MNKKEETKVGKIYSVDHNCPNCEDTFELKYMMFDNTFFTMSDCPHCGFPILLDKQTKREIAKFYEKASRLMDTI